MKKYMAIAGLVLVTVIWGGGFVASDMALDSLSPFQIMTIRFLLASVLMGGISIRNLKGIKKEEVTAGVFMGAALFIGFSLQIHRTAIYDPVKKMRSSTTTNVVNCSFYCFSDLPEKGRIQRYNRSGACHSRGGASVPG